MIVVINKILSIFLIIAVGIFCNRIGILPDEMNKCFNVLLFDIISPCMILSTITSKELTDETLSITLESIACGIGYMLIAFLLGFLFIKKVLKFEGDDFGVLILLFAIPNGGFMGFPVTLALFGEDVLFLMVIVNVIFIFAMFTLGFLIVHLGEENEYGKTALLKEAAKSMKNPSTISAIIGLLMLFLRLQFPGFIFETIDMVGDSVVSLSMLMVGMLLGNSNIKKIVKNKKLLLMVVIRSIILPVSIILAVNWLPIPANLKVCLGLAAALPSAVAIAPIAEQEGKNSILAAEGISLSTLLSMAVIPITASLLTMLYL